MQLCEIRPGEPVNLNTERLEEICNQLGYSGGETAICAAMEDLATMLHQAKTLWASNDFGALHATARQVALVADRIGMAGLAQVAGNVRQLSDGRDAAALAATIARMRRLGEQSLLAIWDRQDLRL
ncbi:MAG: hypothetical protein LJE68_02860 [Rhodobacter sp.]|nr:hypothetical protein [Rhodobacter sp.]